MSNMSYCRFENTCKDLIDCHEHMDDEDLSVREKIYRDKIIKLCKDIYLDYGECEKYCGSKK